MLRQVFLSRCDVNISISSRRYYKRFSTEGFLAFSLANFINCNAGKSICLALDNIQIQVYFQFNSPNPTSISMISFEMYWNVRQKAKLNKIKARQIWVNAMLMYIIWLLSINFYTYRILMLIELSTQIDLWEGTSYQNYGPNMFWVIEILKGFKDAL